mmetsp:Transcript_17194/g.24112  ORF Transcript_17194/g.24112 Transcript_17194/m.24112 type:complete len:102 (-) Transcript_17194:200-505(-)
MNSLSRTTSRLAPRATRSFSSRRVVEVAVSDLTAFAKTIPRTHHTKDPHAHLALDGVNWSKPWAIGAISFAAVGGVMAILTPVNYQMKKGGFYERAARGEC